MDHLFHPWHWWPVLAALPVLATMWGTLCHRVRTWKQLKEDPDNATD